MKTMPAAGLAALLLAALAGKAGAGAAAPPQTPAANPSPTAEPAGSKPVSLEELARRVEREGLSGTVHGADPGAGTYVFTWWDPADFFDSRQFSLVPANAGIAARLPALSRHQKVWVKGRVLPNTGPQPHILVQELTPGERWEPAVTASIPLRRPEGLRRALEGRREIHALVHALSEDGGMLVVEYRDEIVPVRVPDDPPVRETVASLYRGDRILLRYRIGEHPDQPVHLEIDPDTRRGRRPLVVTDRIKDQDGRQRTVEGDLVLFPKSPALLRSIWGVENRGPEGLNRYFTIMNFDDPKDQARTEARLKAAWDAAPEGVRDGRNKFIQTRVRVRVTGTVSNPAPNQANPTLVTTSAQVEVLNR